MIAEGAELEAYYLEDMDDGDIRVWVCDTDGQCDRYIVTPDALEGFACAIIAKLMMRREGLE